MTVIDVATLLSTRLSRRTAVQRAALTGAGAGLALTLGGTRLAAARHNAQAEGDIPEVVIVARDMAFEVAESFEGGLVKLTLDNQGESEHHAMFMRVNDDASLEDLESALMGSEFGAVFAVATSLGGPMAGPGGLGSVIADLPAGDYVLICAIPGPDGMPHYQMGMQAVVQVSEPAAVAEAPVADGSIELMEMMFHGLGAEYAAGPITLEVVNAGAVLHELVVMQMAEGFTSDMFMEMVLAPPSATPDAEAAPPSGPPPFTMLGGVAPMSAGYTNFMELVLAAGEYVALCFVPDVETGAPHAALGMVMPFVVV